MRAWLLLTLDDYGSFAENDGYDDVAVSHYSWDSTVANHANIEEGDVVLLWNGKFSLGISTVEKIERKTRQKKTVYSCPDCRRSKIQFRKTKEPAYMCHACGLQFDDRHPSEIKVTTYRSEYTSSWIGLEEMISAEDLRNCCISPKSQHSMREINWILLFSLLSQKKYHNVIHSLARRYDRRLPLL